MIADLTNKSKTTLPLDPSFLHRLITTLEAPITFLQDCVFSGFVLAVQYESHLLVRLCTCNHCLWASAMWKVESYQGSTFNCWCERPELFQPSIRIKSFCIFSSNDTGNGHWRLRRSQAKISKKLVYHFQKAQALTMAYEYQPRTSFLSSMNIKMCAGKQDKFVTIIYSF